MSMKRSLVAALGAGSLALSLGMNAARADAVVALGSDFRIAFGTVTLGAMEGDPKSGRAVVTFSGGFGKPPVVTVTPNAGDAIKIPEWAGMNAIVSRVNTKAFTVRGNAGMVVNYIAIGPRP